jgi:hypothetical protein
MALSPEWAMVLNSFASLAALEGFRAPPNQPQEIPNAKAGKPPFLSGNFATPDTALM